MWGTIEVWPRINDYCALARSTLCAIQDKKMAKRRSRVLGAGGGKQGSIQSGRATFLGCCPWWCLCLFLFQTLLLYFIFSAMNHRHTWHNLYMYSFTMNFHRHEWNIHSCIHTYSRHATPRVHVYILLAMPISLQIFLGITPHTLTEISSEFSEEVHVHVHVVFVYYRGGCNLGGFANHIKDFMLHLLKDQRHLLAEGL